MEKKKKIDLKLILALATAISWILQIVSAIWIIIEAVNYFNDNSNSFNWWGVGCYVIALMSSKIFYGLIDVFYPSEAKNTANNRIKKSKFQQRLDELKQEREP